MPYCARSTFVRNLAGRLNRPDMPKILLTLFLLVSIAKAQEPVLYHPEADADKDIAAAVSRAKAEKKHVFIMAGGNWCGWCLEFNRIAKNDRAIDSLISTDYIVYHLNYSRENMNKSTFDRMGFPQRFGFPVFIILNGKGDRLHTQNSEYLEDGNKSYNRKKVFEFLAAWKPSAIDPSAYEQ